MLAEQTLSASAEVAQGITFAGVRADLLVAWRCDPFDAIHS